jgi:DNA-binding Lrp family transcriptional regulator
MTMALAYVLVKIAPEKEKEVFNKINKLPELLEVRLLFGDYDIIGKIEANTFDELGEIVVDKIRSIEGVIDTKTLTAIEF